MDYVKSGFPLIIIATVVSMIIFQSHFLSSRKNEMFWNEI